MDQIQPAQIRGARGLLDWSMVRLATAAGVSVATVKRIESEAPQPPLPDAIRLAVKQALEEAGVRFLVDDGSGPGVRLRPP